MRNGFDGGAVQPDRSKWQRFVAERASFAGSSAHSGGACACIACLRTGECIAVWSKRSAARSNQGVKERRRENVGACGL